MFRLFPAAAPPDIGVDELFAEALRRADSELGTLPGLTVTHARAVHSGPFDSVLCSAVVWSVVHGRSTQVYGWKQRRLA
jgi:hypothetical protein